jgi:hypothetical protein
MRTEKDKSLRRKQQRRRKVRYLRRRIVQVRDLREREQLVAKLRRISPCAPIPGT